MSLIDEIKIKSLSDAQEILKSAGTEDILDFEKAHKDGDLHPNGKYVWVSSANGGRGDWRTLNGRIHKKHQATIGGGASSSAVSSTTGASSKKDNSSTKTTVVSKKSSKPDFSKLKSWAEPFVKLFNEPENLKSIAKTIDYIDMNKPMKVSKMGSRDSKVFSLRYINKSGVPQVEHFSYDGSSAPGMYGWSANAAVKKIFEQNADVLPPLKIDSSGNVLGIKMVDNNSKTTSSKSTKTTSSKSKKSSSVKVDIDTIDQDEYNRMYKQAKSVDKQGRSMALSIITSNINTIKKNLEETISNRPGAKVTIKKLQDNLTKFLSQKKAVEDVVGEIDNSKSNKTSKTETYSHDINGVSVNVSKNKDGSYTLEANGKKVKSDDPSFFKDKLTPRVKKALAKEVGIDATTSSKKTSSTNSLKSPSKVFKKISAKNLDELYTKTLSYIGGRIRGKINNNLVEGIIRNSKKKDDRVVLTVKKDDGSLMMISTSIRGIAKYQAPQPDASKIKEIKEGKKEVKISSAMGATDWSTLNYLINSGIEIQYQHGLSFRGGSNSSKKIDAEEALEKIHKNTTFDASVDGGVLYIHTYSGFDMD